MKGRGMEKRVAKRKNQNKKDKGRENTHNKRKLKREKTAQER
jgi:hypothetical protein